MAQLPGERLKEERLRQQQSEQEVANKLHLSMTYLRALEADNYEQLPEATFIKGYFRNYARLLGLPADEITQAFEALLAEQAPVSVPVAAASAALPRQQLVWLLVAAVVLVVLLGWWMSSADVASPSATTAATTTVEPTPATMSTTPAAPSEPAVSAARSAETPAVLESPASTPSATAAAESASPVAPAQLQTAELKLTFSADCWVVVADANGESLFKGTRRAGSELHLSGQAPFQLMLGNAAGVTGISVDGKPVELPKATAGEVVNLQAP